MKRQCSWGQADILRNDGTRLKTVTTCPAEAVLLVKDLAGIAFPLCQEHVDFMERKGVTFEDPESP